MTRQAQMEPRATRNLRALAAVLTVLFLPVRPAWAQVDAVLLGSLNDMPEDVFACAGGGIPCNLYARIYSEADPGQVNSPLRPEDGWPSYREKPSRYRGDANHTGNFGTTANEAPCEAWYQIWTGAIDPGLGTFRSYYGSQSQIVNYSDLGGNSNFSDCAPDNPTLEACFAALDTQISRPTSPNTPLGSLQPEGAPVPVPTVTAYLTGNDAILLAWPTAAEARTLNLPSVIETPCPPGTPPGLDDLMVTSAPNPVYGLGLFVHALPLWGDVSPGAYRSLASLEGGDATGGVLSVLANPGSGIACTGAGNCPGVHPVPCAGAAGATCLPDGILFAPTAQSISLTEQQINTALLADGPLGSNRVAVFNTKVFFRCSVPGSCANPARTGVSASLVSLFSANSTRVSFEGLVARVVLDREPVVEGNRVTLFWSTIGGPFLEFRVARASDGIVFSEVGIVPATGAEHYEFSDVFRGRRPGQVTYRLIAVEPAAESQLFVTVDLSPGARRPRR